MAVADTSKPILGNYNRPGEPPVQPSGLPENAALYEGLSDYQSIHADRIQEYKTKHNIPNTGKTASPTYFRDRFYELTIAKQRPAINTTYQAPKSMEEIFGAEYVELYQLALEEEINSKNYMDAVLDASTKYYQGEIWCERPIVFVGGPSASGKSFAADSAIQQASRFLKKEDGVVGKNAVISIDGGIAREVSQVRKLALKTANNMGYSGIADLHAQSQPLRKIKHRIYNHAMNDAKSGVVIPETFSAFIKPNSKAMKMMQQAMKLSNAKPIFTRVDGQDTSIFQKVVKFMGGSRAWATGNVKTQDINDLNSKTISESKAYGGGGFYLGLYGSLLAEFWFKLNSSKNLSMVIVNDLVLKKEIKIGNDFVVVDANPEDEGAFKVSQRVYDKWEKSSQNEPLKIFMEKDENKVGSLIHTSGEVKIEMAKIQIEKMLNTKYLNTNQYTPLAQALNHISKILNSGKLDHQKIASLEKDIQLAKNIIKSKYTLAALTNDTFKQLRKLTTALEEVKKELNNPPQPPTPPPQLSSILSNEVTKQEFKASTDNIASTRPMVGALPGVGLTNEAEKFTALAKSVRYAAMRYIDLQKSTFTKLTSLNNNKNAIEIAKILRDDMRELEQGDKKDLSALQTKIAGYLNQINDEKLKNYLNTAIKSYELSISDKKTLGGKPNISSKSQQVDVSPPPRLSR